MIPSSSLVFVDTAALVALINADDALHERALQQQVALKECRARIVTSDWVLAEFLGSAAKRMLRRAGLNVVDAYRESPDVSIAPATRAAWRAALNLYRSRPDKEWSLVDCSSILTCRARGITRVFTHDHHFTQAGFTILL